MNKMKYLAWRMIDGAMCSITMLVVFKMTDKMWIATLCGVSVISYGLLSWFVGLRHGFSRAQELLDEQMGTPR